MDFFTRNRVAVWIIVVLVALNLSAIVTMWVGHFRRPPPLPPPEARRAEDIRGFLKRELGLTDEQADQFRGLQEEHFDQSRALSNRAHELEKQLVDEVFTDSPDNSKVRKLTDEIGSIRAEMQQLRFSHYVDLKSVCDGQQRQKLKALFREYLEITRPPGPDGAPARRPGGREGRAREGKPEPRKRGG